MSIVKQTIEAELRIRAAQSNEYHQKITESKSGTKQIYFKKKIKKNNQVVAELLIALERLATETPTNE